MAISLFTNPLTLKFLLKQATDIAKAARDKLQIAFHATISIDIKTTTTTTTKKNILFSCCLSLPLCFNTMNALFCCFVLRNPYPPMDFRVFQDPMVLPGIPGIPGPPGSQGRDGVKGQTGDKGSQGMLGQKGEKGNEGPRGKSGPPGMMGIKGARGTVGDQGIKGDKGKKGEGVTSSSSAVPQTNWKQCVWKADDHRDSGKIKVRVKCSD